MSDIHQEKNVEYVIKGHLIPFYDEEKQKIKYSEYFRATELAETMKTLINNLKELIKSFFDYTYGENRFEKVSYVVSDSGDCDENLRKLHAIGDLIVLFFRLPLIGEVDPEGELRQASYFMPIIESLKSYVRSEVGEEKHYLYSEIKSEKEAREINENHPILKAFLMEITPSETPMKKMIEIIKESFGVVKDALFRIPSDTRPLANASSLLVHLVLTSTLAWGQLSYKYSSRARLSCEEKYKLEIARLASLLHDIGKPLNWISHVSRSTEVAEYILGEFVDGTILEIIKHYIKKHHIDSGDVETNLDNVLDSIIKADRYSSGQDRLLDGLKEFLSGKSPEVNNMLENVLERIGIKDHREFLNNVKEWLDGKVKGWQVYNTMVNQYGIKTLSKFNEEIIKEFKSLNEEDENKAKIKELLLGKLDEKKRLNGIVIYKIDLRGIQNFIYSGAKLSEIIMGSRLVEYFQVVEFPIKLISKGIPLETILYSAGGNIFMIIPENMIKTINNIVNESLDNGAYRGLKGSIVVVYLKENFMDSLNEVEKITGLNKLVPKIEESKRVELYDSGVYPNIFKVCNSCRTRPASIPESGGHLCLACYIKRQLGRAVHFPYKWERLRFMSELRNIINGTKWEEISNCIIEFIAGHTLENVRNSLDCKSKGEARSSKEYMSFAILKMDANAVGKYMADTFTLTHLVYKSFRIDLATKLALSRVIKKLYELADKHADKRDHIFMDVMRIYLGLMYVGGDDVLVLIPSYLALPFAHIVSIEFAKNMGFDLTVSVGIVAGKPKLNIWELFEVAELLLDDLAKKEGRKSQPTIKDGFIDDVGAVVYLFWKSPTVSKYHAKTLIEFDKNMGLRLKTINLSERTDKASLISLLKTILLEDENQDEYITMSILEALYNVVLELHGASLSGSMFDKLKKLRNESLDLITTIRKAISGGLSRKKAIPLGLIRLERNYNRLSNSRSKKSDRLNAIVKLKELYYISPRDSSDRLFDRVPLVEVLQAIDFTMGGVTA